MPDLEFLQNPVLGRGALQQRELTNLASYDEPATSPIRASQVL